ncbi:hypothetical protein ACPPVU_02230 [Mucilaginibacter sp. McL0603]|uniref:hypothetical protein n=1 Tax=Mucilaginibacter sp. McL0603 TaxID=3415670 RepID=UPI003CF30157
MIASEKIRHFFKPSAILLFILIFLIFGYCPVRDSLFSALGRAPQTAQHKKIGEIKTFTYHICQESGPDKLTPVLAHISNANPLAFIAVGILIFCTSIVDLQKMAIRYQDIAVISSNQVPIYLRNKVLRI